MRRYGITLPEHIIKVLETPRLPVTASDIEQDIRTIATPSGALAAAASVASKMGFTPLILGDAIEGESAQLGIVMAGIAKSVKQHGVPVKGPAVLLSGGETTVTIGASGAGHGGRNTEFLLSLACALKGEPGIYAIAGDTDGIDGTEDAAGAIVTPDTLTRTEHHAREMLAAHDSYSYFAASGDWYSPARRSPTSTILGRLSCCKALPGPLFHRPGKHSPLKAYDKPVNLRTIFKLAPLS